MKVTSGLYVNVHANADVLVDSDAEHVGVAGAAVATDAAANARAPVFMFTFVDAATAIAVLTDPCYIHHANSITASSDAAVHNGAIVVQLAPVTVWPKHLTRASEQLAPKCEMHQAISWVAT